MAVIERRASRFLIPPEGGGVEEVQDHLQKGGQEFAGLLKIDIPQVTKTNAQGQKEIVCVICEKEKATMGWHANLLVNREEGRARAIFLACTTCVANRPGQVDSLVRLAEGRVPWATCTQEDCKGHDGTFLRRLRVRAEAEADAMILQQSKPKDEMEKGLYAIAKKTFEEAVSTQTAVSATQVRKISVRDRDATTGAFTLVQDTPGVGTTYRDGALEKLMERHETSCYECHADPFDYMPLMKVMCTDCFKGGFYIAPAGLCCGLTTDRCRFSWNGLIEHGGLALGDDFNNPRLHSAFENADERSMLLVEFHGSKIQRYFLAAMPEIEAAAFPGQKPKLEFEKTLPRQFSSNMQKSPAIDMVVFIDRTVVVLEADGNYHDYISGLDEADRTGYVCREMLLGGYRRIFVVRLGFPGTMSKDVRTEALERIKKFLQTVAGLPPIAADAEVEFHFRLVGWKEANAPDKHLNYTKALMGDLQALVGANVSGDIIQKVTQLHISLVGADDHQGRPAFPGGGINHTIDATKWDDEIWLPHV